MSWQRSEALEASRILSTTSCRVTRMRCYTPNGAARWAMLFDATELPVNGASPIASFLIPAGENEEEMNISTDGIRCAKGAVFCLSTTADTLTLAGADSIFQAEVRNSI